MSASSAAIATAVAVGKALIKHAAFSCEVVLQNRTDDCLLPDEHYIAHGNINPSAELPPLGPWFEINDTRYPADDHVWFPQVVGMYGKRAPAAVMQWKFANRDLYMLVFAYMGGVGQTNAGYFRLSGTEERDLQSFWDNAKKNETWFYSGDLLNLTDTVDGIVISGDLDNNNPARFNVYLDYPA